MYNYCTLFDSHYLTRGLVMYESLKKHSKNFHLYIFAFDDKSLKLLKRMKLDNTTLVSLEEFEDKELLEVKSDRSVAEYCWTCTPSIIKHAIEKFQLKSCTYIDADVYFYGDPSVLVEEMRNKSVLITEHRYTKGYERNLKFGIYCVQFITFKSNDEGMKALNWWRNACIKWCYAKLESGRYGDQKYLDDWTKRFKGVHVLKNLGGGVAPWNVQQYDIKKDFSKLIFYHFHNFKMLENNKVDLSNYKFTKNDIDFLYKPYFKHLHRIYSLVRRYDKSGYFSGIEKKGSFSLKGFLKRQKRILRGTSNILNLKHLIEK